MERKLYVCMVCGLVFESDNENPTFEGGFDLCPECEIEFFEPYTYRDVGFPDVL